MIDSSTEVSSNPNKDSSAPLGVILAGGPGSRIGGGKPWRKIGERRLIDLAMERLGQVCPRLVVVTGDVSAMADLDCEVIADRWPGQGPLAALVTVFLDTGCEDVLLMAVDMPLVSPSLIKLVASAAGKYQAAAPMGPRGPEPLLAYYHRSCLPAAQRLLDQGERRTRMLLDHVKGHVFPAEQVAQADPLGHSFFNVNFPEDLEKAKELATDSGFFNTLA